MPTRRSFPGPAVLRRRRVLASTVLALSVGLNVWAVAQAGDQEGSTGTTPPSAAEPTRTVRVAPTATSSLPVVQRGDGRFTVFALPAPTTSVAPTRPTSSATPSGSAPTPSPGAGRVVRYTVEVEGGLGADTGELASVVSTVLTDPRGWQTADTVRFVNVSPAEAAEAAKGAAVDVRVTLASPDTTDRLCAPLETRGEVSCHNGGRAVLNARRWLLGVEAYGSDLAAYRTYLVNHEVGHALGHGHVECPGAGEDAPVMMQQTYGLDGCVAWPYPTQRT